MTESIDNRKSGETCLGAVEIKPGEGRAFTVDNKSIAVFRNAEGTLYALGNVCPHAGGQLAEGWMGSRTVTCPQHGWKFELQTGRCATNPDYRVRTYPVREADGQIYVTLP